MSYDHLWHWTEEPFTGKGGYLIQDKIIKGCYEKPKGLWVSAGDGEDGWRAWCEAEEFHLERLRYKTRIRLTETAKIIRLEDTSDIDQFTLRYRWEQGDIIGNNVINWGRVSDDYDGIIIAPYCWPRRLHRGTEWYYTWDCASGCLWDPMAYVVEESFDTKRKMLEYQGEDTADGQ